MHGEQLPKAQSLERVRKQYFLNAVSQELEKLQARGAISSQKAAEVYTMAESVNVGISGKPENDARLFIDAISKDLSDEKRAAD